MNQDYKIPLCLNPPHRARLIQAVCRGLCYPCYQHVYRHIRTGTLEERIKKEEGLIAEGLLYAAQPENQISRTDGDEFEIFHRSSKGPTSDTDLENRLFGRIRLVKRQLTAPMSKVAYHEKRKKRGKVERALEFPVAYLHDYPTKS